MIRLSEEEFGQLVHEAVTGVPEAFQPYLDGLSIEVEPMPSLEDARSVGRRSRRDLLGLYHGTPLTERSIDHPIGWPERVVIYQRNIERICRTRDEIVDQVRRTVLHEIGHHFGLDEDDLDELGYG